MKITAVILSLIVLGLTFFPCTDSTEEWNTTTTAANHHTSDDSHETGHADTCSPFCVCSCCSGISVNHLIQPAITTIPAPTVNYSARYIGAIKKIALPIWQPPQLTA